MSKRQICVPESRDNVMPLRKILSVMFKTSRSDNNTESIRGLKQIEKMTVKFALTPRIMGRLAGFH